MSLCPSYLFRSFLNEHATGLREHLDLRRFTEESGINLNNEIIDVICTIFHQNRNGVHLKKLTLSGCVSDEPLNLWRIAEDCGSELQELYLSGFNVSHVGLRALSIHCLQIRLLDVSRCEIVDDLNLRIIASLWRTLVFLDLSYCNRVSDDGVCELAKCCHNLRHVSLRGCCRVAVRSCRAFGKYCKALESLDLFECKRIEDAGIVSILKGCIFLTDLKMSKSRSLLGYWSRNVRESALKSLWVVDCCHIVESWQRNLSSFGKRLEVLNICGSRNLKCEDLALILENCNAIVDLNISRCKISNKLLHILAKACPQLIHLQMASSYLVDETAVDHLIRSCIDLTTLDCTNCVKISHKYLEAIAPDLKFSTLHLSDSFVGFRPRGDSVQLRKSAKLKRFRVKNSITIQRIIRGLNARRGVVRYTRQSQLVNKIVPILQAKFRGKQQRKQWIIFHTCFKQTKAVSCIQQAWRNELDKRRDVLLLKEKRELHRKQKSATTIQLHYRCFAARKVLQRMRKLYTSEVFLMKRRSVFRAIAITKLQSFGRRVVCRRHYLLSMVLIHRYRVNSQLECANAVTIQSAQRRVLSKEVVAGLKQRRDLRELQCLSSTKIQAIVRMQLGRNILRNLASEAQQKRKVRDATKIQTFVRAVLSKCLLKRLRAVQKFKFIEVLCATKVQSIVRLYFARINFLTKMEKRKLESSRRKAACLLQRLYRGTNGRKKYFIERELKSNEALFATVINELCDLQKQVSNISNIIVKEKSLLGHRQEECNQQRNELQNMKMINDSYFDTSYFTGVKQRYKMSVIAPLLAKKIKHEELAISETRAKIELKVIEEREITYHIRSLQRKLAYQKKMIREKALEQFRRKQKL